MRKLFLTLFSVLTFQAMASHIVGGEFELIHLPGSGFSYRINLILYFDENEGLSGAKDADIHASIFRKRDNVFMRMVDFNGYTETPVFYTQPACSNGEIRTSKLAYTTVVTLPSTQYNDPEGYYIIWERCCRNYEITNIISDDPNAGGQGAGQTFYLEFPPVVKNGQPFINSSPRLFPPLNDYACPLKSYYVDFAGTDDDGDSLVYTLVTPLSTHTQEPTAPPAPRPYPLIQWVSPFSETNIINGSPDLKISIDGFLTATPPRTGTGLYVFAVRCEEYRDGVKIGELRRDFQMKVVDRCADAAPPQILGKKLSDATFGYDETMNVTFPSGVNDADRCIQVQVSDPDALRSEDNFRENIYLRAIPLNFKKDVTGVLPAIKSAVLVNGSTYVFDICFEDCPYIKGPFQIGIVAYDDACSLPLSDTLKVTVNITPPLNRKAYFTTANIAEDVSEDQVKTWALQARDDDGDVLTYSVIPNGFNLQDYGMKVDVVQHIPGLYEAQLVWDTHCNGYDFSNRTAFNVKVIVDDADYCNFQDPAVMILNLNAIRLSSNPIIDSDLTASTQERDVNVTKKMFETLSFTVTGNEADNHLLVLDGKGVDFDYKNYGITFSKVSGNGNVSSPVQWNITCDNVDLKKKSVFDMQFILADDASKCRIYNGDTLDVHIYVQPATHSKPQLSVSSLDPVISLTNGAVSLELGQQIALALKGNDFNTPSVPVTLNLIDATGNVVPTGYEFTPVNGIGQAQAQFIWQPDCSIFKNGVYKNDYVFTFNVINQRCSDVKGDTLAVNVTIQDKEQKTVDFIPPNFVTPNNDSKNEFFAMMMINNENDDVEELVSILPIDNCNSRFMNINIYNRWGKEVFSSTNRDFKWYPKDEAAGVYYYYLHYSDKVYKGSVSVRF
jgi:hypothetical protein